MQNFLKRKSEDIYARFQGQNMRSEPKTPKHRPTIKVYKSWTTVFVTSYSRFFIRGLALKGLETKNLILIPYLSNQFRPMRSRPTTFPAFKYKLCWIKQEIIFKNIINVYSHNVKSYISIYIRMSVILSLSLLTV